MSVCAFFIGVARSSHQNSKGADNFAGGRLPKRKGIEMPGILCSRIAFLLFYVKFSTQPFDSRSDCITSVKYYSLPFIISLLDRAGVAR